MNEVIVFPKIWTKNCKDFCSVAQFRAEILWFINDLINSFWNLVTFSSPDLTTNFECYLFVVTLWDFSVPKVKGAYPIKRNTYWELFSRRDFLFVRWKKKLNATPDRTVLNTYDRDHRVLWWIIMWITSYQGHWTH